MMKYLLKENKKHGDTVFPVCLYNVDHGYAFDAILPCHWHEEFEILYVSRGSAVFRIDDQSYEIHEGQFLFVNSGELHSASTVNPSGCCYHAVVFHLSLLNSSINDICQNLYIDPLLMKQHRLSHSIPGENPFVENIRTLILGMIERLANKGPGVELHTKGSLLMILSHMAADGLISDEFSRTAEGGRERTEKIKKVIDFISENYSKKIQLDELAELVNMNRYNFCRFFKRHVRMTPVEYLNLHRVNEACHLLQNGSCSVTEAALQTGFESMSYFTKLFKKYKNIAPSKLKNQ